MTESYYDLNHIYRFLFSLPNPPVGDMTPVSPPGGTINLTAATTDPGTSLFADSTHQIMTIPVYPYNMFRDPSNTPASFAIVNGIGTLSITTTQTAPKFRFIAYDGSFDSGWQSSNSISGLAAGKYLCLLKDNTHADHVAMGLGVSYAALAANVTKNDVSFPGGSDGQVTVNVTDGSGDYLITWWDATTITLNNGNPAQSTNRVGVAPGTYAIVVHDNLSGTPDLNLSITITEPVVVLPFEDFFYVPKFQSFEFVHEIIPNGYTTFQTLDNVRFINQIFPYFKMPFYTQKVLKNDVRTIQWQSNYENHLVQLRNWCDDTVIDTFLAVKKVNNLSSFENFAVTLRDNGAGQTRVYFHTTVFPIPISVGDVIGINANADGFDGNYQVVSIGLDTSLNSQYFVINKPYMIVPTSSEGNGVFFDLFVNFNVFESVIDFSTYTNDNYYIYITALKTTGEDCIPALSEPIELDDSFIGLNCISCKNLDNAWDIDFSTGIVLIVRVESNFFKRKPKSIIDTTRNTTGQLIKTRALKQRGMLLELIQLPPYLHEKLSIVFDSDFAYVNAVQYSTDQAYGDPNYLFNYGLADSSIDLEQFGWMKTYNSDDLAGQLMPDANRIFDDTFDTTFN